MTKGSRTMLKVLALSQNSRSEMAGGMSIIMVEGATVHLSPITGVWFRIDLTTSRMINSCTIRILDQTSAVFDLTSTHGRCKVEFPDFPDMWMLLEAYTYPHAFGEDGAKAVRRKELKSERVSIVYDDCQAPIAQGSTVISSHCLDYPDESTAIRDEFTRIDIDTETKAAFVERKRSSSGTHHSRVATIEPPRNLSHEVSQPASSNTAPSNSASEVTDWSLFLPKASSGPYKKAGELQRSKLVTLENKARGNLLQGLNDDLSFLERLSSTMNRKV